VGQPAGNLRPVGENQLGLSAGGVEVANGKWQIANGDWQPAPERDLEIAATGLLGKTNWVYLPVVLK